MSSKLKPFVSFLAFVVSAAAVYPQTRALALQAFLVLGAIGTIATVFAMLPGKAGAFFAALGKDVEKVQSLLPQPPADGSGPSKPSGPPAVLISALVALSMVLGGCSWLKAKEPVLSTDAKAEVACILSHYAAGDSAETTAAACGGLLIKDVIDLFMSAQKAGLARGPAPAGSVKP